MKNYFHWNIGSFKVILNLQNESCLLKNQPKIPPKALLIILAILAVKLAPSGQEQVGGPLNRPQALRRDPSVLGEVLIYDILEP